MVVTYQKITTWSTNLTEMAIGTSYKMQLFHMLSLRATLNIEPQSPRVDTSEILSLVTIYIQIWKPLVKCLWQYCGHKVPNAIFSNAKSWCDLENWANVTKSWYVYPKFCKKTNTCNTCIDTFKSHWCVILEHCGYKVQNAIFSYVTFCFNLENWAEGTKTWYVRDYVYGYHMS